MIDLKGKTALVTGGSRGIGKAIAFKLARAGAEVIITSRSDASSTPVVTEAQKENLKISALSGDVTSAADCRRIVQQALEAFGGKLDILVNNAGITQDNLFMKMKEEEWDQVLATNLTSLFHFCKAVIRPMMKQRAGRIINIGSVVGHTGNPGQVNYATTKAGMLGFSQSLAKEVASRNILVNVVSPGFIATDMTAQLNEEQKTTILEKIPLNRLGQAEDIAGAVLFLAGDLSSYITGTTLHVNGGMY